MPIYSYKCSRGHTHDELYKWPPPESMKCGYVTSTLSKCRCKSKRLVTMPAKTAGRWGDTSAKYIPAFGKELTTVQAEKEARRLGLVSEYDLPRHYIEDKLADQDADAALHLKTMSNFETVKKETGDASRAWAETFSTERMISDGNLNSGDL